MKPKNLASTKRPNSAASPRASSPSYPGVVRGPASSKRSEPGTELPHERDETTGPRRTGGPDPLVEQAYRDVKSGQVDTDLRETSARVFKQAPKSPRAK